MACLSGHIPVNAQPTRMDSSPGQNRFSVGGNRGIQTARGRTRSAIRWACSGSAFPLRPHTDGHLTAPLVGTFLRVHARSRLDGTGQGGGPPGHTMGGSLGAMVIPWTDQHNPLPKPCMGQSEVGSALFRLSLISKGRHRPPGHPGNEKRLGSALGAEFKKQRQTTL
jgi:hypothetical protein